MNHRFQMAQNFQKILQLAGYFFLYIYYLFLLVHLDQLVGANRPTFEIPVGANRPTLFPLKCRFSVLKAPILALLQLQSLGQYSNMVQTDQLGLVHFQKLV